MVFEPNFTKVVSGVRNKIGITQSVVELKLPTNENDISKIYTVSAKSNIISSEINGKEVSFLGVVDFQAIYESNSVVSLDYSAEFKDKLVSEEAVNGELVISSNVIDISSSVVSGGIKVVAVLEICVDEINNKETNVLTSVSGDDSHVSTGDIEYSTYEGKAYEKFDVSEEFSIDGATNILMITPCISIFDVTPRNNYLVVNGRLNINICYQDGNDIVNINNKKHEVDFTWEVAFNGIKEDSCVQNNIGIITSESKISTTIEDGVAKINVNIPVNYTGYVFTKHTISVIEDLYRENNYLSVTCEQFKTLDCKKSIGLKDNISGTASISEVAPFIDEVLGVTANNIVVASSRVEDGKLYVEGIANSSVVYYTKETSETTSVQVEMPFAVEKRIDGDCVGFVSACINDLTARSKRGKEIEVAGELNVFLDVFNEGSEFVISNVLVGEQKPNDDCSFSIYVVRNNETLWDVAKENNVSQELILAQNPNVELPIKAGDKLIVYKSNTLMF